MNIKSFIFSEKKPDRLRRHFLFWFCYWLYFTFFHICWCGVPELAYFENIPYTTVEAFSLFLPQVFFAYTLLYLVLPNYLLKNKYFISLLWIVFFLFVTFVITYVMLAYANEPIMERLLPQKYMMYDLRSDAGNLFLALTITGKGTLVASAGACSIRLVKYWHLKEQKNLALLKERTEAQLELLRAQVHPHFLFNTLNNIYFRAQNESPGSAKMIRELSHILRYVLNEGERELVPLEKEIQMLIDYVHLEKMRYDDKLDLHLSLPSEAKCLYIAPLLLLPFIENCFKHGASKMLNSPWINLKIELVGPIFFMKV
ncbi:MAG TPA: histidine kinase, partial [Chitinophagaceae bacterium]